MSELHILLCPWDVMTVFPQTTCQGRIMTSALRVRLMDLWSPQCVRRLRASGVVSSAGFLTSVIWKQDELRVSPMPWNSPNVHFGIVQILSKRMENYCFIGPVCADAKVKYYIENEWQLLTERNQSHWIPTQRWKHEESLWGLNLTFNDKSGDIFFSYPHPATTNTHRSSKCGFIRSQQTHDFLLFNKTCTEQITELFLSENIYLWGVSQDLHFQ